MELFVKAHFSVRRLLLKMLQFCEILEIFLFSHVMMFLLPGLSLERACLRDAVNTHSVTASE